MEQIHMSMSIGRQGGVGRGLIDRRGLANHKNVEIH